MPTIYLAGDSTVATYPAHHAPMAGWGQVLGTFFQQDVAICNHAAGGRSSKSFIDEGRLAPIAEAMQPGDYLLIQFGHNDEKADVKRHTTPEETYPFYLRQYIAAARAKGATPVLLTSVERRQFDDDGHLLDTHGDYPSAVIRLAQEEGVAWIDLQRKSRALFESLGVTNSKPLLTWLEPGEHPNYPEGKQDNTHFNETGAVEIAKLVVAGIREADLPLAAHLLDE